ncbi:hypothetical protein ZHAS_00020528 [Anopheles sinensis]|uniref:Uncharacterized protein n=1 Tax=Anopheles sinensis TaxID=74873 RepID=A0A084WQ34_ANOSI|nr:hypothetical protein ZHAS_00020528 [Anopheles sinensis]
MINSRARVGDVFFSATVASPCTTGIPHRENFVKQSGECTDKREDDGRRNNFPTSSKLCLPKTPSNVRVKKGCVRPRKA